MTSFRASSAARSGTQAFTFGYERYERVDPIRFAAWSLDEAREQAARHWQAWLAKPYDTEPEGFWVVTPDHLIRHIYVHPDGGDTLRARRVRCWRGVGMSNAGAAVGR